MPIRATLAGPQRAPRKLCDFLFLKPRLRDSGTSVTIRQMKGSDFFLKKNGPDVRPCAVRVGAARYRVRKRDMTWHHVGRAANRNEHDVALRATRP